MTQNLWTTLVNRGYIYQATNAVALAQLLSKPTKFYVGLDPTGDSLHAGHLLVLMTLQRLQKAGHIPHIIVGSSTGFIGDPSDKNEARKLLDKQTIAQNTLALQKQLSRFLDPQKVVFLENNWLQELQFLTFLRDYGKHFAVNRLLTYDIFKRRLNQNLHLSFLEFCYPLLQGYDFYHLHQNYGVQLQFGGSDQWANILTGVELIKKTKDQEVHGFTLNLLKTSNGQKMGKSAQGALWLDPNKTTPYEFYQYFLNLADTDIKNALLLLTDLPIAEINTLTSQKGPAFVVAKQKLAALVTAFVHGETTTATVVKQSQAAFAQTNAHLADWPTLHLKYEAWKNDWTVTNLLVISQLATSKSEAIRLINQGGVMINNVKITDHKTVLTTIPNLKIEDFYVTKGKKKRYRIITAEMR